MCINLGRETIGMPQQLLDVPQGGACLQKMSRIAVAERMDGTQRIHPALIYRLAEHRLNGPAAVLTSGLPLEKPVLRLVLLIVGTKFYQELGR